MPLIEGLGDEVTLVLGAFIMLLVLMVAWVSTHTADIPLLREVGVIVVELTQRRNRATPPSTGAGERSRPEGEDSSSASSSSQGETDTSEGARGDHSTEQGADPSTPDGAEDVERNKPQQASLLSNQGAPASDTEASTGPQHSTTNSSVLPPGSIHSSVLPDMAEMLTSQMDHMHIGSDDANQSLLRELPSPTTGEPISGSVSGNTDEAMPPASVIVDESGHQASMDELPDRPGEEEMRRRRVQYYQTDGTPESGSFSTAATRNIFDEPAASCDVTQYDPVNHMDDQDRLRTRASLSVTDSARLIRAAEAARWEGRQSERAATSAPPSDPHEPLASQIRVKLKYMNETHRLVVANPSDTIGDFRRTHFQPELADNKLVRFIFNGQDLRDDARTLQACNVADNCTMHCLITQQQQAPTSQDMHHEDEGEDSVLGSLMYPLFTVILVAVWYFRLTYRQYFSALSTVVLVGITFLLGLSYVSSLRGPDLNVREEGDHPHMD